MERIWGELGEEKAHDQNISFSTGVTLGLSTTLGDYFLTQGFLWSGVDIYVLLFGCSLVIGISGEGGGVVLFYFLHFRRFCCHIGIL